MKPLKTLLPAALILCCAVTGCMTGKNQSTPPPSFKIECLFIRATPEMCDEFLAGLPTSAMNHEVAVSDKSELDAEASDGADADDAEPDFYLIDSMTIYSVMRECGDLMDDMVYIPPVTLQYGKTVTNSSYYGHIDTPDEMLFKQYEGVDENRNIYDFEIKSTSRYPLGTRLIATLKPDGEIDYNIEIRFPPKKWKKFTNGARVFHVPVFDMFGVSNSINPGVGPHIMVFPLADDDGGDSITQNILIINPFTE